MLQMCIRDRDRLNAEMTGLKWPTMLFYRNHYELPKMVTYSEKALKERLSGTVFFDKANIHAPVDAYIGAYSPDTVSYTHLDVYKRQGLYASANLCVFLYEAGRRCHLWYAVLFGCEGTRSFAGV